MAGGSPAAPLGASTSLLHHYAARSSTSLLHPALAATSISIDGGKKIDGPLEQQKATAGEVGDEIQGGAEQLVGQACEKLKGGKDQQVTGQIREQAKKSRKKAAKPRATKSHPIEATQLQGKRKSPNGSDITRARKMARVSPQIVTGSPMINMFARNAALKKSLNAVRYSIAKRAKIDSGSPITKSPTIHDLSPAAPQGSRRRPRRLTSSVWKEADPIYIEGHVSKGQCRYCNAIFPASKDTGTSQLSRHLKVCELKMSMDGMVEKIRTSDEVDPLWRFDQNISRLHLVKFIVKHELPFSLVEYDGFKNFCASLNPWFKLVSRVTIQNDTMDAYDTYREDLQDSFRNAGHRVSLTGDMWTSNQKLGYLCITCHWIEDWKPVHHIMRFCLVESPHNALNIFNVVLKSLQDWNIEDKLSSFTLDNAAVNDLMIDHLRKTLVSRKLLHYQGNLLHVRCASHVINLIVQDGLTAMQPAVDNIRASVSYIRSSPYRKQKFAEIVVQLGIECKQKPTIDVTNRWNSTFLMFESTLPFRKVFEILAEQEQSYQTCPSVEEWEMAEAICQLLKVFHHATNVVSGSNYATSNQYFLEMWSIKVTLEEQARSKNKIIVAMVKEMQAKFDKYFTDSYLTNCVPVILDPRFKLDFVEMRLKKYFGSEAEKYIKEVKKAIKVIFKEYEAQFEEHSINLPQETNIEEVAPLGNHLSDWDEHVKMKKARSSNELQRYLEEDFHPCTANFDILKWWAVSCARFPILGSMARDLLAFPASTVPSESAFSTCGRVINDYRSSLAPETVEALMCLGNWFTIHPSTIQEGKHGQEIVTCT